ncbi:MAG: hypothetical protein L6R41_007785 [Letrouitia leprolyta]|nr:MAG: hypothetical protein L6R41_007785 [Letrouitia leprolyta]
MASQPPAARQQPSQPAESLLSASSRLGRSSPSHSTYSEDSQTVILNTPSSEEVPHESGQGKTEPKRSLQRSQTSSSAAEPKKCWICFSDETEDNPTTAEWRSPCPCALTAHESCLLDWIADKESSPQNGSSRPQKIECPQCKAEIVVARPRSRIVEWHQSLQDAAGRLFWPGIIGSLVSGMGAACVLHGASTVYLLLGTRDAEILLGVRNGRMPSSNTILGLASIPGILMISSTSLADPLLPVLPVLYFAANRPTSQPRRLWPPSAAMTLVALPYLRAAYRGLRKKIFQEREKEWTRQIQPRAGEDRDNANQEGQEQAPPENEQGGGMNFELGVELEIVEEEEVAFEPEQQEEPVIGGPAEEPAANGGEQRQDPDQQQGPRQGQAQNGRPDQGDRDAGLPAEQHRVVRLVPLVSAIVHTMIGALAFPAVAASMGGLISIFLPRTWKTPPSLWDRRPLGFLQSRFGRSVVGGCLFLFLKDTLSLYSKYRLAQDHLQRRVLDYERNERVASAR